MIQIADNVFILETENTAYQMKVKEDGLLAHIWYGPKTGQIMDYLNVYPDCGFSGQLYENQENRTDSPDTLKLEYPCEGIGDYRITAAGVSGGHGLDLRYQGYEIKEEEYVPQGLPHVRGTDLQVLIIHLKDEVLKIRTDLQYVVDEKNDAIVRNVSFINEGENPIHLNRMFSMALDLPKGEAMDVISFPGRHNRERIVNRQPVNQNILSFASKRGTSSHQQNPGIIICPKDTTEEYGEAYGVLLMYSGSFKIEVEKDQSAQTRIVCGINPDVTGWTLYPKQAFDTPQTILFYSDHGLKGISECSHRLIRERILSENHWHPILINTWEAVMFDFDREKLMSIAEDAAKLDVDLYVLDDGWFGARNHDRAGLGDWKTNEAKLGGPLKDLIEDINKLGMEFGIWIEPEMVNEDSDLYRSHPDWVLKAPNRKPVISRGQMVLDMTRPEVIDHLEKQFTDLLNSGNIRYVKWDMNRSLADLYSESLPAERQDEVSHRYVLGVYDLLDRLTGKFPEVLFEGCSGGGGRFDAGMLFYTPQIWCSDDTDVHERSKIQYGTSFFYPPCTMGSHVSEVPNQQTGRDASLDARAVMAMAGTYGYELDPGTLSEEEQEKIRDLNHQFRQVQDLVLDGDFHRLSAPDSGKMLMQFSDPDRDRILVSGLLYETRPNTIRERVRLKDLDEQAIYRTENGEVYTGKALMSGGLLLDQPWGTDYPIFLELTRQ